MNISYNWLKQYVDFDLTPEELAAALTSIGLETGSVERVESIKGGLRGIVIGKVLTCVDHPDSDHLHITTVDLGDGKATQIVCGAPNVAAGQTVVVATVGTTLYDGDKEFNIKKSKIRGVESFGMICAEDEIGIGNSHAGIIVLADGTAEPGTPAAQYYGLSDDYVLEVDLTPNRIDAASHYGVARDLSAWLCCHANPAEPHRPSVEKFKVDEPEIMGVIVEVEDNQGCPRYCGATIKGVKVTESPQWLKDRLNAIGVRPINNVVDITNYVLHAFGQPMHCFDASKIADGTVVVRNCPAGTKFTTLDGVERTLTAEDLMICNGKEPMCIAGVFGGLDSGVTEDTVDVFLESAYFNPTRVRKTARRQGLNTDSSFRFERGVDPNGCMYALKIAALLVKELAGGEIVGKVFDVKAGEFPPFSVELSYEDINALIGKKIPENTVDSILKSLEIEIVAQNMGNLSLEVPTYRVDVKRPCDVIEDILRIYGYNNVEMPTEVHSSLSFKTITDVSDDLQRTISEQLTAEGFNEILNNSLTAEKYYAPLECYPATHCVKLLNPLSQDLNVMRQTLLFGGLETIMHNVNRKMPDLLLYEFGNVYFLNPDVEPSIEKPLAPYTESSRLALWLTGNTRLGNWARPTEESTFFDLKAIVANVFARLGINSREVTLQPGKLDVFETSLSIDTRSGKHLGDMGIIKKSVSKECDVKQEVLYAELDWTAMVKLAAGKKVTFAPLPRTMPVKRDLALLVDSSVTMEQVEQAVREAEKKLLKSVSLFDVYEGKNLPEGKKSYAIAMTIQDPEKTLQDKQIDQIMAKIIANLQKRVGAELR
ncbi:MAG: phenylalanine--tRNA ligase subunit beta [Bacteroidales bacterium]|nr:phenylalanine--tRNA ligase subunit beta [Bacteroidales bacterium]